MKTKCYNWFPLFILSILSRKAMRCLLASAAICFVPAFSPGQVEKVATISNPGIFRLRNNEFSANERPEDISFPLGDRVVFRASVNFGSAFGPWETWVIDEAGNRQVLPQLGTIRQVDEQTLISTRQSQIFALDQLYRSDGTPGGTYLLHNFGRPVELLGLNPLNVVLLFG